MILRPQPPGRRHAWGGLGAACALLALGCSPSAAPGADRGPGEVPPDLILVSLDTLRSDRAGERRLEDGGKRETMPSLEAWASDAVEFERAYSSAPMTAPSHMSMLSGLVPLVHGVRNINSDSVSLYRLNDAWPTLAEVLQAADYTTGGLVQAGNVLAEMGFERGFDDYLSYVPGGGWRPRLNSLLDQADSDQPLFLFLHSYLPHAPYLPPSERFGIYCDTDYQGVFRERYDSLVRQGREKAMKQSRNFLAADSPPTATDRRFLSDLYDENLLHADRFFEEAMVRIRTVRGGRPTLWCVTSDHGEAFGEHGELGHPGRLDSELLRIPLWLRAEGFELAPPTIDPSAPFGLESLAFELALQLGVEPAPTWCQADGIGAFGSLGFSRDWSVSWSTADRRYLRTGGRREREEWVITLDEAGSEVERRERTPADDVGFAQVDDRWRATLELGGQHRAEQIPLALGGSGREALEGLGYVQEEAR